MTFVPNTGELVRGLSFPGSQGGGCCRPWEPPRKTQGPTEWLPGGARAGDGVPSLRMFSAGQPEWRPRDSAFHPAGTSLLDKISLSAS